MLKITIKNGDGEIDLEECADLLDQKADQYGLSKKGGICNICFASKPAVTVMLVTL